MDGITQEIGRWVALGLDPGRIMIHASSIPFIQISSRLVSFRLAWSRLVWSAFVSVPVWCVFGCQASLLPLLCPPPKVSCNRCCPVAGVCAWSLRLHIVRLGCSPLCSPPISIVNCTCSLLHFFLLLLLLHLLLLLFLDGPSSLSLFYFSLPPPAVFLPSHSLLHPIQ